VCDQMRADDRHYAFNSGLSGLGHECDRSGTECGEEDSDAEHL